MPISGNMIPAEQINSIAAKILSFLPPPTSPLTRPPPSNNYFRLLPSQKTTDALDSKIDWTASARDTISARFSFSHPVISRRRSSVTRAVLLRELPGPGYAENV